jgi:hypothetical protein
LATKAWAQEPTTGAPTALVSATPVSESQVPRLVKFSDTLQDDSGKPRTGITGVTFLLYKDQTGGAPLWLETQNVNLDAKGHYTILLGSSKSDGLPAELFASGEARWLAVQAEHQPEQPRVLLLSVPYALKAMDAETLGGRPVSDFALSSPQNSNSAQVTKRSGAAAGDAVGQKSGLATVTGSGTKNFIPIWTSTTALGNSTIFETGGKVGIGTTTPGTLFDVNGTGGFRDTLTLFPKGSDPTLSVQGTGFAVNNRGLVSFVSGQTFPGTGTISGVTAGTDLIGGGTSGNVTLNLNTSALQTQNDARYAKLAANNSFTGNQSVLGNVVINNGLFANTGSFVGNTTTSPLLSLRQAGFAEAMDIISSESDALFASSGANRGVAIVGEATAGTSFNVGLNGFSASSGGVGTFGTGEVGSNTAQGIAGCCAIGVWGDSGASGSGPAGVVATADDAKALVVVNNSPSGLPTAILVNNESSTNNLGVLVAQGKFGFCSIDTNGNLFCSGNITPVVPVDHGQRHVALYYVEAPQNWFEDFGSGQLASGAATVPLDPTFTQTVDTVSDYHVFLTPEGDCRGLYVSHKTATGFEVREFGDGQSNIAFSYRVVALRQGYQSVRLADMTQAVEKVKTSIPKPLATPGLRLSLPVRPAQSSNLAQLGANTPNSGSH